MIKKDKQIRKFCYYGFLKDLKFFEPYLILYLMNFGFSLFQIGLLYSVKEAIVYFFEIPSGILADNYGKKKELQMCFIFYMISFGLFAIGKYYGVVMLAMVFFGLGEAFRSGTHKAMIYTYLEQKRWFDHKRYVYGLTRSYSLTGAAISSAISILLAIKLPLQFLFIIGIIPYVLDFLLIMSYPDSLDERRHVKFKFRQFVVDMFEEIADIMRRGPVMRTVTSSAFFDAVFKTVKDYIQPILKTIFAFSVTAHIFGLSGENSLKVVLGLVYGVMYMLGALASKNGHRLQKYRTSRDFMNDSFTALGFILLGIGLLMRNEWVWGVILLFLLLYIVENIRRPCFVDVIGDMIDKNERATILSVESQLKSIFVAVLAPLIGLCADYFSIDSSLFGLGIVVFVLSLFIRVK